MDYAHDLLLFHTVTPLHVGCGQDVGVVDLPVIRERTTGYPFVPGSGTRGALRAAFPVPNGDGTLRDRYFGPEGEDEAGVRYAGSVSVHDAKLLLLPVRSSPGVYAWLTAPTPMRRLHRDLQVFELALPNLVPDLGALLWLPVDDDRFVGPEELVAEAEGGVLYLEEYAYRPVDASDAVTAARSELLRWSRAVAERLGLSEQAPPTVLVSDQAFHHFARFATVVQQHNKLTSAKTVQGTALFSLEAVPPETVFHGLIGATAARWPLGEDEERPGRRQVLKGLRNLYLGEGSQEKEPAEELLLHLGGGESTGLGVTRLVWLERGGGDAG